ncbi:MAG TPA: hypothetical protein VF609_16560 [Flavisolibacter sp.]|jgi:hypothetical protein
MIFSIEKHFIDSILESFSQCFEIVQPQLIEDAYKAFQKNFDGDCPKKIEKVELTDLVIKGLPYSELGIESHHYGIDLPVLLSSPGNSKAVIFISEDPLRRSKDPLDTIILSTPFGIHLLNKDNNPNRRFYRNEILLAFLTKGYNVYVTDIFKIWIKGFGHKLNLRKNEVVYQNSIECLKKEIEFIKNQYNTEIKIVTFGRPAEFAVRQIEYMFECEPTYLMHPSHRFKNKKDYFAQQIRLIQTSEKKNF